MYQRTMAHIIRQVNDSFPVLLVAGPRQIGKTTLLEMCTDDDRNYVTLDDLDARALSQKRPRPICSDVSSPPLYRQSPICSCSVQLY